MRRLLFSPLALCLLLLLAFAVFAPDAMACPNCKDSLTEGDPAYSGIVRGFFWSIIIMLATPMLILAGLGSYFYWLIRKAQAQPPQPIGQYPQLGTES